MNQEQRGRLEVFQKALVEGEKLAKELATSKATGEKVTVFAVTMRGRCVALLNTVGELLKEPVEAPPATTAAPAQAPAEVPATARARK